MSGETTPLIEQHWFDDDGVVPNNPRLPLVVYRGVLESGPGAAAACETLFAGNGWSGGWRGDVYPYSTITAPRMRRSASSPARLRCVLAATAAPSSICMPA